jgi:hypothetical protein
MKHIKTEYLQCQREEEVVDTKVVSESVNRRGSDNTMANRRSTKGQTTILKTYT